MMEAPTNLFIDGILVDETMVAVSKVLEHLMKLVLATKHPEPVEEGAKLGLRLERDSPYMGIPEKRENISRRELFSVCRRFCSRVEPQNTLP